MSFKPEVSTDGGRTFHQNALAFATREDYYALLVLEGHQYDRRVEE